jgi:imidazolonepropionase-like amidohydrolase
MRPVRIAAGRLIDGRGGVVERAALLVEGDRVAAVGREADVPRPEGALEVDASTRTVMPGLIDAHVHLAYSGSSDGRAFRAETVDASYPALALRAASYARAALAAGFVGVRDCHAPGGVAIDVGLAVASGWTVGPRVAACGLGLSATGGHMDEPGWGDHLRMEGFTAPCDGADAYRAGVRAQRKRGAAFIKVNACHSRPEGMAESAPARFRREMTDEELAAVVHEAHMHGLRVAAHAVGGEGVAAAVAAGIDSIEHGHWIDDATLAAMAAAGTAYVPTLTVNERNFELAPDRVARSPRGWAWLEWSREIKWETLARARAAGVTIMAGSDSGYFLPHGAHHARELAFLVHGGSTALEAITAATATPAAWLGWADLGTLTPGARATFLIVDGDPSSDVGVLADPQRIEVVQDGRRVAARGELREERLA